MLGAGILQVPIIKRAKELGIYVIATDGSTDAPGLAIADEGVVIDIVDRDVMLDFAQRNRVTGVIHPCSEVAMDVMGFINETLCLSGIDTEMAHRATNKALMREAFEKSGAPSPKSYSCGSLEDGFNVFRTFTHDLILKPSRNSGSRGVTKLSSKASDESFITAFNRALENSRDNFVVIEDFIDGPEFSIEALVYNGCINILATTQKKTTDAPYFVELGHAQPANVSQDILNELHEATIKGIRALKLNNCATHTEIKICNGKAYIMEIGARLGGDFITTRLTPLSTGIDMVGATVLTALGRVPDLSIHHQPQAAAIRYITPEPGIITDIRWSNDCLGVGVVERNFYKHVGDVVNDVQSSLDRSGHVIAIAPDVDEAIRRAEAEINTIEISISK